MTQCRVISEKEEVFQNIGELIYGDENETKALLWGTPAFTVIGEEKV